MLTTMSSSFLSMPQVVVQKLIPQMALGACQGQVSASVLSQALNKAVRHAAKAKHTKRSITSTSLTQDNATNHTDHCNLVGMHVET